MAKDCRAPEEFPGLPDDIFNFFSNTVDAVAEEAIFKDYVLDERINEFTSIFPKRNFDGSQVFRDVTGLNTQLFISFLETNNPGLSAKHLAILSQMKGGGIRNPDWCTHRPVQAVFEYYEVKPDSTSGRRDGSAKFSSSKPSWAFSACLMFPESTTRRPQLRLTSGLRERDLS